MQPQGTYHEQYGVRSGIRKPRLGNSATLQMAKDKGWVLDNAGHGNGQLRNVNFSIPEAKQWYSEQLAPFHGQGVDFWWNDEGETTFFTFHHWNDAEVRSLRAFDAKARCTRATYSVGGSAKEVLLVGLGETDAIDAEMIRRAAAIAVKEANQRGCGTLHIELDGVAVEIPRDRISEDDWRDLVKRLPAADAEEGNN